MRKLLLFLMAIAVIGVSSCTKDAVDEISQEEKEFIVKNTLIEFSKSAIKSGKYTALVNKASLKTENDYLPPEELEKLVEEFLGEQTKTFLNFYYMLVELNLSTEEFLAIAEQFEYLRPSLYGNFGKNDSDCCNLVNVSGLGPIITWFCKCGDDDTVGDESDDTN